MPTFDGERVFIPNSAVWRNPIVNHTGEPVRRTTLTVGVAYGSSLGEVGGLLVETLEAVDGVKRDPAPQAHAYEFADSSINFSLRFWHDSSIADQWVVRDAVTCAVHEALGKASIEIPFPQRVVEVTRSDAS
jgi:small-conductance mechanosensitive channel